MAYFIAASHTASIFTVLQGDMSSGTLINITESAYTSGAYSHNRDHTKVLVGEHYTQGDNTLSEWTKASGACNLLFGAAADRNAQRVNRCRLTISFLPTTSNMIRGLLMLTVLFDDARSLAFLDLDDPQNVKPIPIMGVLHHGQGELVDLEHLADNRYILEYNIDGCSWIYEARLDEQRLEVTLEHNLCGQGPTTNGVAEAITYDRHRRSLCNRVLYSHITYPDIHHRRAGQAHPGTATRERILGIQHGRRAPGEDASYTSFDGTRISARLYMPSAGSRFFWR